MAENRSYRSSTDRSRFLFGIRAIWPYQSNLRRGRGPRRGGAVSSRLCGRAHLFSGRSDHFGRGTRAQSRGVARRASFPGDRAGSVNWQNGVDPLRKYKSRPSFVRRQRSWFFSRLRGADQKHSPRRNGAWKSKRTDSLNGLVESRPGCSRAFSPSPKEEASTIMHGGVSMPTVLLAQAPGGKPEF